MTPKRSNLYAGIAVTILVIALIIFSLLLVHEYRILGREESISTERLNLADLIQHHSLGATSVNLIESWMTFNYVSISFKVPISYLTNALQISSSTKGYPNITLGHYAKTIATSSSSLIGEVRTFVREYLVPKGE